MYLSLINRWEEEITKRSLTTKTKIIKISEDLKQNFAYFIFLSYSYDIILTIVGMPYRYTNNNSLSIIQNEQEYISDNVLPVVSYIDSKQFGRQYRMVLYIETVLINSVVEHSLFSHFIKEKRILLIL